MASSAYNIIKQAILDGKNIKAEYQGYPREMTPHALGMKGGKEHCLFYQFGGRSKSATSFPENSPSNWRCVFVGDLKNVEAIGGDLKTCTASHSKKQTCVDQVDVEIKW